MSGKAIAARALFVVALAACSAARAQPPAGHSAPVRSSCGALDLERRVLLASRIYGQVTRFFPELSPERFDAAHAAYVGRIVRAEGRRELTLASMELLASLGDGHTWFSDRCLDRSGGAVGFIAHPIAGRWTVVRSQRGALRIGDVIVAVDGTPIDDFFRRQRRYIAASSEREAGLLAVRPAGPVSTALPPDPGRPAPVVIDRATPLPRRPAPRTEDAGWWRARRVHGIPIPGLRDPVARGRVPRAVPAARGRSSSTCGNPGAGYGLRFKATLMDRPYRSVDADLGDPTARSSLGFEFELTGRRDVDGERRDRATGPACPAAACFLLVDALHQRCEILVCRSRPQPRHADRETTGSPSRQRAHRLSATAWFSTSPPCATRFRRLALRGSRIAPDIAVPRRRGSAGVARSVLRRARERESVTARAGARDCIVDGGYSARRCSPVARDEPTSPGQAQRATRARRAPPGTGAAFGLPP